MTQNSPLWSVEELIGFTSGAIEDTCTSLKEDCERGGEGRGGEGRGGEGRGGGEGGEGRGGEGRGGEGRGGEGRGGEGRGGEGRGGEGRGGEGRGGERKGWEGRISGYETLAVADVALTVIVLLGGTGMVTWPQTEYLHV